MKKIIVPIDFSEHSEYALETAAILAKKYGGEIIALHMLEINEAVFTQSNNSLGQETLFFIKLANERFENFLQKDFLSGVKITPVVRQFKVFSEVNDVAKEQNADLVVIGSHGSSGLREIFIGSNTEKVVRHSEIPVLVIKNKPKNEKLEDVVFASNFAEESVSAYKEASKIFDLLNVNVHLLYVNVPGEDFMSSAEMNERIDTFLNKAEGNSEKLDNVKFVSDYTVEQGVLNYANSKDIDIIVIPTHGRTGIAHFFSGSISEDIANHAERPVMTFRI